MANKIVRKYITQDLSHEEKKSYLEYINGDESSTDWIEKASVRREYILNAELQCNTIINNLVCNKWVTMKENGKCICSIGHPCYDIVLQTIKKLE